MDENMMHEALLLAQEAAAEGVSYPDLCEKIIEISLAKYPEEKSDF